MVLRSIIQGNSDECYICHGKATDTHHCIGGSNRQISDKYGLTVRLCRKCHINVHNAIANYEEVQLYLKKVAQQEFEKRYSHEKFMQEFGKNYL